jgi:hypothetical protein
LHATATAQPKKTVRTAGSSSRNRRPSDKVAAQREEAAQPKKTVPTAGSRDRRPSDKVAAQRVCFFFSHVQFC